MLAVAAGQLQAGVIFTSRSSYDTAVSGLTLSWTEDFEGFALGPAGVPTIIGGGAAEIAKAGTAEIIGFGVTLPPNDQNEWLGVEGNIGETIQGIGGSSLGINAIGFDYFSQYEGNYVFHHSGGSDAGAFGSELTPLFVGWVGDPGEVLNFVDYVPGISAHVLDDFVAHTRAPVVPEPASLAIFAIGALGMFGLRRRHQRPA
jgi:hypothetical protein